VPYLILALGLLIHIAFGQIQNTLTAFGNTRIIFIVDVFAVGANAWLNWTLIPMLGITGAAIATATTYTVRNMTLMAFLYYKHGFHPVSRNYITVVLLVTLAAVGISRVELSPSLPLVVASGAILIATTGVGYLRYGISEADVKLFDRLEVRFGRSFDWLRRAHLSVRK
jgi:O-antigen/teichoic acid export membrane protein